MNVEDVYRTPLATPALLIITLNMCFMGDLLQLLSVHKQCRVSVFLSLFFFVKVGEEVNDYFFCIAKEQQQQISLY